MTLLLLAGTREARLTAQQLAGDVPVIASLAGVTRAPADMNVPTRVGGFGGAEGFRVFLREAGITAVLDATHPFAHRISARTFEICTSLQMPYGQLLRPIWQAEPGDRWVEIDVEEEAAGIIEPDATVFLATGRQTLERFANLSGRRLYCRQIDPPDRPFPFEGGRYLVGGPPFSVASEIELFRELKVDWLVVKNAGGKASRAKLDAARALGIRVAMIARPPQPDGTRLETVKEALQWVRALPW